MKVEIYITTNFHGKVSRGSGAYGIVLRLAGRPDTARYHITGWRGLSYQKLNVRAVVEAIGYITEPVSALMYLDNAYAVTMIKKGDARGNAHRELWERYYETAAGLKEITVERIREHEYRRELIKRISSGGYLVKEERGDRNV